MHTGFWHKHFEPQLKRKSFSSCPTITFALSAGRCSAESCWTSWGQCKQWALQRNGLSHHKQARQFSPIDISHHAHTACISIHNLSGGGHWGEEESESEKEDNTVQEYSGALSLAGLFNSLSVLSLFSHCCYLLAEVPSFSSIQNIKCKRLVIVLNTGMGVKAWGLKKRRRKLHRKTHKDKYK